MIPRQWTVALVLLYSSLVLVVTIARQCTLRPHLDECNNTGFLWNCSGLGLNTLPKNFPRELKNQNVTLDLSFNNFSTLTVETFREINFHSNVTSILLNHNNLWKIGKGAFSILSRLCSVDVSYCTLDKTRINEYAFIKTPKLKCLRIHENNFQKSGYPDVSISKILSLQYLKIDLFEGFVFSKAFENLTKLSKLEFNSIKTFSLNNNSFHGLKRSPISNLNMNFRKHVDCDVTEDLFCSFPYLTEEILIKFGGKCNVTTALRSLKCLQHRKVERLIMSENQKLVFQDYTILDDWSMKYLINICVKLLDLGHNNIVSIKTNIFNTTLWHCLEYLYINTNHYHIVDLSTVKSLYTMPKIRYINLCCNNRVNRRDLIVENDNFYRPDILLQKILFNITLPDTLEVLDYSNNYIHNVKTLGLSFTCSGKKLQELYIQNTNFPFGFINQFRFPSLEKVNVSQNSFARIKPDIFQDSTDLREFFATDVDFISSSFFTTKNFFQNLKKLSILDISKNELELLPQNLFVDQTFSLTDINLDNNKFTAIPYSITILKNLTFLFVRNNLITYFSQNDQLLLQKMHNLSIYLEGNPISCVCLHIQSLHWMKNHQQLFVDLPAVTCTESKIPIAELFHRDKWRKFALDCQANDWLIVSSVLLFLTLLILVTLGVLKRYRTHIEYVILRIKNRWKGVHLLQQENTFLYDVYVSYSDDDYPWIIENLYPKLESLNVRAWLKDKDSIPGVWEAEEIVKCINESRKILFVVSESFLDKGWSSYAVQMAVTHSFHNQRQETIVVIIKGDIHLERLPNDIKNIWWCIEYFRSTGIEDDEELLMKISNLLKPVEKCL